jgi:PhnB protein
LRRRYSPAFAAFAEIQEQLAIGRPGTPFVQADAAPRREDGLMSAQSLTPRLVVKDAAAAIDFYRTALAAEELDRYVDHDGTILHAGLRIGDAQFSLTEESLPHNVSPVTLGGSPLILTLVVPDADAVGAALSEAGAEVVFPIADQFYGHREGRLRDPFGHLWIVSQA